MKTNYGNHLSPSITSESLDDALFHYTTGQGLLGILKNSELWCTAYYCTNDESELSVGRDVLTPLFRRKAVELIESKDPRVELFANRGVNIFDYVDKFETTISSLILNYFSVYLSCFCKPASHESLLNGQLSQWRGYGPDGGYAIQFSRKRLIDHVHEVKVSSGLNFELQDVYYSKENAAKAEVLSHGEKYVEAFLTFLDTLASPLSMKGDIANPLRGLSTEALGSLLDYYIQTKNEHFAEERECRLSVLQGTSDNESALSVDFLSRVGLIVPFIRTPQSFKVLQCIDWIVVGPCPRIVTRTKSVQQLVRSLGLDIKVRPSHIPFIRD